MQTLQWTLQGQKMTIGFEESPTNMTNDETEHRAFFLSPFLSFLCLFYASFSYRERNNRERERNGDKKAQSSFSSFYIYHLISHKGHEIN